MKWLTTLLALYLLSLALWPCADEFPASAGPENCTVLSTAVPNPATSHPHHDQCTPFCTCTCCAVTITVVPQLSYALTASVDMGNVDVVRFAYAPTHWADPLTAIWQPPKRRV